MNNPGKQMLEFGPFRIDPEQRLLLRDEQPIPLSPKAFDLLLVLVQRTGQVVLKDDLMKLLWPDTFVEESNLGQHVFQLRKALGERAQDHAYIVTIPGRGYRFVQKVRALPVTTEEIVVQSHSRSRMVIEEETLPARPSPAAQTATRRRTNPVVLLAALAAAVSTAVLFRPTVPAPKVLAIRQLTHLGTVVYNTKVLTDGPRVYFRTWEGQNRVFRYVSPEGGEVVAVDNTFPNMDVDDISPNGSEFLVVDLASHDTNAADVHALWRVSAASGSPRPVGEVRARDARWSPDGATIAYSTNTDLDLVNSDGSNPRKLAGLSGQPLYPQWSRDGRSLRFSLADPQGHGAALWQTDLSGNLRPLLPDWSIPSRPRNGDWTPDGRYYFFTAAGGATRDIFAMREARDPLRRVNPQPVHLTAGPLNFYTFTSSKDGKTLFATGSQQRGEVMRYDAPSRQYLPYTLKTSADHLAFSHDGQWMAYVEYPEGVLVRSRVDLSERRQLTFQPMRVFHPQWSPDGTQLAFQASADMGTPNKVYVVSRDGGLPVLATPQRSDQQRYPSWSSNGESILFSGSDEDGSHPALYSLDLKSRQVSMLTGTAGLYWGQISLDGRYVVALTDPDQKLMLYDTLSHQTRILARLADYPLWSFDGKYAYFSTLYFGGHDAGVYRWQVSTGKIEKVMGSPGFLQGGIWGVWFGLSPTGEIFLNRDLSSTDLYALDLELP